MRLLTVALIGAYAMTDNQSIRFMGQASKFWMAIPQDARAALLANVYCGHCRGTVSIINVSAALKRGDLLLTGNCAQCGHEAARLVEKSGT